MPTYSFAYEYNPNDQRCSAPYYYPSSPPDAGSSMRKCPSDRFNLTEGPICYNWCYNLDHPYPEQKCLEGYTRYDLSDGGFICEQWDCPQNSQLTFFENGAPKSCECKPGYVNRNGECKPACDPEFYEIVASTCKLKCEITEFRFMDKTGWYLSGLNNDFYFTQYKCYDLSLKPVPIPTCEPDETLVDGVCKKIECEPDETLVDGVCQQNSVCDVESNFYTLCQWYEHWKNWRSDFEYFSQNELEQYEDTRIKIDDIRYQDSDFYDHIREYLDNYNNSSPNQQFPIVAFPSFCEWSQNVCNWYLDWQDWRSDYERHEEKAAEDRATIIENQQKDLEQNEEFYDDVRDFLENQENQNPNQPSPLQPDNQPYDIKDHNQVDLTTNNYINGSAGCPADRNISLSLGGYTSELVISYQSLCTAASMFKPFVILMSFIAGVFIITNTGRRAETGD